MSPAAYVKNGRDHVYPIGPESQAILASLPRLSDTYVFPAMRQSKPTTTVFNGWGKPMARFRAELGDQVKPFVLHDLRRVFASGMQRLGVRLEVTESLLGHVSGTRAGIVGVYQVYRWEKRGREAVLTYERFSLASDLAGTFSGTPVVSGCSLNRSVSRCSSTHESRCASEPL